MNPSAVVAETKTKLAKATEHFEEELKKLRTGRAHPGMLDGVMVDVYGQSMPLIALAGITAPEATLLQISPYDPSNLQAISDAIRVNEALGLNPADDGRVVRIQIPPLTAESRQQMVKILHQKAEESAVAFRQIRHDAVKLGDQAEKDHQISKDERFKFEKQIDDLIAEQKTQVELLVQTKEQEITTL